MKKIGLSSNKKIKDLYVEVEKLPQAIKRLNSLIFCKENARKLKSSEFEVVYTNNKVLKSLNYISNQNQDEINKIIGDCFAYRLCLEGEQCDKIVYSDKQADKTDIALSGNKGSGRAAYIGSDFNIKGIGRTSLAMADKESIHGNGNLDLITALREAIISNYIYLNTESKTSPVLAVIRLKKKTKVVWSDKGIDMALLIRYDNGFLDRVSHLEFTSLNRNININSLIKRLATFDSEMFCKRILHGAWSIGNTSLDGSWLDIESVSFVLGRGPRCNITKKFISNYFGFESFGAKLIIKRISELLKLDFKILIKNFEKFKVKTLNVELLKLLGFEKKNIDLLMKENILIKNISKDFEKLAKCISPTNENLNVFEKDYEGNHLLDFSNLFKKIPKIYGLKNRNDLAMKYLLIKKEINKIYTENYEINSEIEQYLFENVVIAKDKVNTFFGEIAIFIENLFQFIDMAIKKGFIGDLNDWKKDVLKSNINQLNFLTNTKTINALCYDYKKGYLDNKGLNIKINKIIK